MKRLYQKMIRPFLLVEKSSRYFQEHPQRLGDYTLFFPLSFRTLIGVPRLKAWHALFGKNFVWTISNQDQKIAQRKTTPTHRSPSSRYFSCSEQLITKTVIKKEAVRNVNPDTASFIFFYCLINCILIGRSSPSMSSSST